MFGHKTHKIAGTEVCIGLDGTIVEHDLKQCCHCGRHWRVVKGSGKIRGTCLKCMSDFCSPQCAECIPYEKKIEQIRKQHLKGT